MTYTIAINNTENCTYTILGYTDNPDDVALVIKNVLLNLRKGDIVEISTEDEE